MTRFLAEMSGLHLLPLWLFGMTILLIFLVAIEVGLRMGLKVHRTNRKAGYVARGDVTISALLALLGLILAFTYAFAMSRYDQRKVAVIDEVNAIGTAFLRADFLPEPGRTQLRRRLFEYAQTRRLTAADVRTTERFASTIQRTLEAQSKLWPATRAALTEDVPVPFKIAIMSAINTVLDVHNKRLAASVDYIPVTVLLLLVAVAAFSLAVTTHNAAVQGNQFRWRMAMFAVVLAALIMIIMDFDTPLRGLIRVSTAEMDMLIHDMQRGLKE